MMVATVQWLYCRRALSKSSLCFGVGVLSLWAVFVYWSITISSGAGNLLRIKGSADGQCAENDWFCRSTVIHCSLDVQFTRLFRGLLVLESNLCTQHILDGLFLVLVYGPSKMPRTLDNMGCCIGCLDVVGTRASHKWGADDYEGFGSHCPILVEFLPLFDHLTLLYRLSWILVVCTIGFAVSHWRIRYRWALCLLAILESLIFSPIRETPACTDFFQAFSG